MLRLANANIFVSNVSRPMLHKTIVRYKTVSSNYENQNLNNIRYNHFKHRPNKFSKFKQFKSIYVNKQNKTLDQKIIDKYYNSPLSYRFKHTLDRFDHTLDHYLARSSLIFPFTFLGGTSGAMMSLVTNDPIPFIKELGIGFGFGIVLNRMSSSYIQNSNKTFIDKKAIDSIIMNKMIMIWFYIVRIMFLSAVYGVADFFFDLSKYIKSYKIKN